MRRLLISVGLALALAAPAAGKEVKRILVCGAGGCRTIAHPDERILGGSPAAAPPAAAPFVRLRIVIDRAPGFTNYYVPRYGLLLGEDLRTWMRPQQPALLRRMARRAGPLPARRFPAGAFAAPDPRSPPHPAPAGGSSGWWWALLALPLAAGTLGRRRVYEFIGARHGRRPGPARTAR